MVHKFVPMPQAMKIPDAKAAVDQGWKKARDDPSMVIGESQDTKKESPLCHTDGRMSFQECGVRTKNYKNTKAESCSVMTL